MDFNLNYNGLNNGVKVSKCQTARGSVCSTLNKVEWILTLTL